MMARMDVGRTVRSSRALELVALGSLVSVGALAWMLGCHNQPKRPIESAVQQNVVAESGCFDGDNLRKSWVMDERTVRWNSESSRFENGRLVEGKRDGCWTVWHKDGVFDSDSSGTFANDVKIESAPSPVGDYGLRGDSRLRVR